MSEVRANRKPLRIALVTETYPPEVNGVSMTVARVVQGMRARHHAVQLVRPRQQEGDLAVSTAGYEEVLMRGLPIPRYPHLKMGLPQTRALLDLWTVNRPDLVHIATEGPLGWSALRAARRLGVPVSSDFRTNFHAYARHYGLSLLKRPVLSYLRHFHSRTACTMVPTESLRRELSDQGFRDLSVVARGVDTVRFHPDKRSSELRRQWGVADDDTVAICVGRLALEKNLTDLVGAFRAMRCIDGRTKLVIVGDGPARSQLQAQCPDAVLAGSRTGDDLAAHYASADVFVFPSLTETFGNVTPEAMASGLPVLAYSYAAAAQLIQSGANGLLAEYKSSAQFELLAEQLVADPCHARRMGVAARRTAERLDWDTVLGQIEALFLKVARGGDAGDAVGITAVRSPPAIAEI
ncbi:MAG: glycosyltransferase family 1 protein [Pseudomonadota bacterium]|nr:glycosyltransferase family 1 protein [Pseudomonadota bacterium]